VHNYDAQQHRADQIISPLTLQTITIAQMLSVGGDGDKLAVTSKFPTASSTTYNNINKIY